ncbi:zinc finger protein 480-like isoform X2 [Schistocerca cancellata]|uniref:zinc finger protein 480-like isoform X2 n=1 Tax=Schistocerca cancellata TaxID=274614 RepID=UPI0021177238|nr:zinc finger protein 480-like isoform X2 [Schistocerca cancellata]
MMAPSDGSKSCVKCQKTVNSKEIALVCGLWCRKSFHSDCVGLSNRAARAVSCSKEQIKFHCEACENRLGIELVGGKEAHEPKSVENSVNSCLLELVEKLLKLTYEISHDNSAINTKLDTVLSSNARLEEYLLQSLKCYEKRSGETPVNSVVCEDSDPIRRITEINVVKDTTSHNQSGNSKQMCCPSEHQQTDNSSLRIASDLPSHLTDGQQKNVAEACSSNCLQEWEVPDDHSGIQDTRSIFKECLQEWEVPGDHNGTQDPLCINKEICPPSADLAVSGTFNIEKMEDEEDEKPVSEDVGQECSASEDIVGPSTFVVEKIENEEDKEPVEEEDFKELKHEVQVQFTSNGSESESTSPVGIEDAKSLDGIWNLVTNVSQAAGTGYKMQYTTKEKVSCGNKSATSCLVHCCDICKKMFANLRDLKGHTCMIRCDYHSCCVCRKKFARKSDLKRHFLVHTGERPYSCGVCGRRFSERGTLKRHALLHTGERPYSCAVCGKRFIQRNQLKQHLRVHTDVGPHICGLCNKTFKYKISLKRHAQLHTGERPYRCAACSKTFTQLSYLKQHSLLHAFGRA